MDWKQEMGNDLEHDSACIESTPSTNQWTEVGECFCYAHGAAGSVQPNLHIGYNIEQLNQTIAIFGRIKN